MVEREHLILEDFFVCPCCKQKRRLEETFLEESFGVHEHPSTLEAMMPNYQRWLRFQQTVHEYTREKHIRFHTFLWACKPCLKAGAAIQGDLKKQSYGMGGPLLAYVSLTEVCDSCGTDFPFSAEEQKYWYETLGFHIDSYPKNCPTCRKVHREKIVAEERLGELLNQEGKLSLEQLKEVQKIYEDLGREEKAELFARRVANKERKES